MIHRDKTGWVVTCSLDKQALEHAADWLTDRTAFWNASPDQVFRAWTDPVLLIRWFCPNPQLELDFRGTASTGSEWLSLEVEA